MAIYVCGETHPLGMVFSTRIDNEDKILIYDIYAISMFVAKTHPLGMVSSTRIDNEDKILIYDIYDILTRTLLIK